MNIRAFNTVQERRKAVEKELNVGLNHIGSFTLDDAVASTRNCENMIGAAQIPMGIAGPITIKRQETCLAGRRASDKKQAYYIPLATTEGALVASVNRGCKAITQSGGASVLAVRIGATRGPVFKVKNLAENSRLYDFVMSHKEQFSTIAGITSKHITLMNVETNSVGLYRYVRFTFDTQNAMGLNMVTIATQAIVDFIEKETRTECISLSGNYCVDKKPSWINFTRGRGFEVWSEVVVPGDVLKKILKTRAEHVYETWLAKCMIGSAMSGSMGFNAQYANILSALFIATGQDPAHVAECSVGITTAAVKRDDLYISIYLPDVMVGTVGGGTGLATQQEALTIMGIAGGANGENAQKLAEIVGAAVLAGELSLLSSLSEGSLARSHMLLARGKR